MRNQDPNPILQDENYYEGYHKKIDELKNNKEALELDKLTYAVFQTDNGKRLLEVYTERYLFPAFVSPHDPNAPNACLYFEGFKQAYRMIFNSIRSHEQRIDAENHKS